MACYMEGGRDTHRAGACGGHIRADHAGHADQEDQEDHADQQDHTDQVDLGGTSPFGALCLHQEGLASQDQDAIRSGAGDWGC